MEAFGNVSEAFLEMFQKHFWKRFGNVLEAFLEAFGNVSKAFLEAFWKCFRSIFGNISETFWERFEMICYDSLLFGFESIHFLKDLLILYCFISVLFQRITWEAQTRGLR